MAIAANPVMLPPVRLKGKYYTVFYSNLFGYFKVTCNGEIFVELKGLEAKPYLQMLGQLGAELTVDRLIEWRYNQA